jgi:hypothetical protein
MPFVSQKQEKWMWANKPEMAKEWASKTPDIKSLPEKVPSIGNLIKRGKKA